MKCFYEQLDFYIAFDISGRWFWVKQYRYRNVEDQYDLITPPFLYERSHNYR